MAMLRMRKCRIRREAAGERQGWDAQPRSLLRCPGASPGRLCRGPCGLARLGTIPSERRSRAWELGGSRRCPSLAAAPPPRTSRPCRRWVPFCVRAHRFSRRARSGGDAPMTPSARSRPRPPPRRPIPHHPNPLSPDPARSLRVTKSAPHLPPT